MVELLIEDSNPFVLTGCHEGKYFAKQTLNGDSIKNLIINRQSINQLN